MSPRFDFVVVGGGVFGAGTAWELARRGASVAMLESQGIACGASGGPGKRGVRANSRDERELPLARMAHEIWPALHEELGAATGFERTGGLELFETAAGRERALRNAATQVRRGVPTRLVEREKLLELEPGLSERVAGAACCPDDGTADHTATTLAYARAAERAGAVLLEHTAAATIEASGGTGRAAVDVHGMRHEAARAVIVLANAGAPALLAPLGVRVPALPVCPQVLFTAPVAGLDVRHLIGHLERRLAVKQLPGGDLMISGGWLGRWDEAMQRGDTIEENVAGNMAEASAVFPALAGTAVREAYADRAEAVGPELLPLIDHVPGFSNIVLGTGWSGHGFAIAPAVVRLLAHWLLGGAKPRELAPFHWRER